MNNKVNASREQIFLVKISSRENAHAQLREVLAYELKGEYIQSFGIETLTSVKWQITEAYSQKIVGDYDDEEEARDAFEILETSGDGADYSLARTIE